MQIDIPNSAWPIVQRRAAQAGFASVSDYLLNLLLGEEAEQVSQHDARIAAAIDQGYASGPPTPMTEADWDNLRMEMRETLAKRQD